MEVMERISQDRSLPINMGLLAKKKLEGLYSIEKAANTIEKIYQNCLAY
jgi:hypothetical protein